MENNEFIWVDKFIKSDKYSAHQISLKFEEKYWCFFYENFLIYAWLLNIRWNFKYYTLLAIIFESFWKFMQLFW